MRSVEAEARRLTYRAWFRRDDGRLFELPEIACAAPEDWDRLDDTYFGLAVGIMPVDLPDFSSDIVVGEWRGMGSSHLGGRSLRVRHLGQFGATTHRSPLNIGYVHVLPESFQRIVEADWRRRDDGDDDGDRRCGNCEYVFKGDEKACRCHYTCGGCCLTTTVREERGYDKMLDQMIGKAA